jgi:hypothetical protein
MCCPHIVPPGIFEAARATRENRELPGWLPRRRYHPAGVAGASPAGRGRYGSRDTTLDLIRSTACAVRGPIACPSGLLPDLTNHYASRHRGR